MQNFLNQLLNAAKEAGNMVDLDSDPTKLIEIVGIGKQLLSEIWGYESSTDSHTVDVHIGRLRERFKDNPDFTIVTLRGVGYKVVRQ